MAVLKSEDWFANNVFEQKEELIKIGEEANKMLFEQLAMEINNPKTTIALYVSTFSTICEVLKSRQEVDDEFCINIADRFKIGYTNVSNDDEEKDGNFMIYIQHVDMQHPYESLDEDETDTAVLCALWNAANIKVQAETIKEIAVKGRKNMSNMINIKLDKDEFVMPLFAITHDAIVNHVKRTRTDSDLQDYQLNVAGLYTIGESIDVENVPEMYFEPSITLKLMLKDDANAGSTED